MILTGNNLGERHRDLNSKVSEAVTQQTDFEELRLQPDNCDVDVLFKIDLASKYRNVHYVLEVLKCGDVFHITRALKCLWLYDDEYSQYINTDYLEKNIFPCMSRKMRRKTLTAVSIHMRSADRAIDFYKYCKDANLNNYAVKFLVFTPDNFKVDFLKHNNFDDDCMNSRSLKQFIDGSFEVALAYLRYYNSSSYKVLQFRFLYSVSEEQYLNILDNYIRNDARYPQYSTRIGIRISKDILKKYKLRIFNIPLLYINILNKSMLVKYLTAVDIKTIAVSLLPKLTEYFWSLDFYNTYKFILEKIPANEIYSYVKQIYTSQYNDSTFEMRIEFYELKYYEWFNIDEREAWALRHIEQEEELPGIPYYTWYKFLRFRKAFPALIRYIYLTPDKYERSRIVNILPETVRNENDLRKMLRYYYRRHVNESEELKVSFINKVIEYHDLYSFNDKCWTALDKLFYSLDVYTCGSFPRQEYTFRSLIYHILHGKTLPVALKEFIEGLSEFYYVQSIIEALSEERKAIVAKYLLGYVAEKIKSLTSDPGLDVKNDDLWEMNSDNIEVHGLVCRIWVIIRCFKRPNEDCPKIAVKYMESNMNVYVSHDMYKVKFVKRSEEEFVRWLKLDIETAVNGIYEVRCNTYRWNFRLCRLFRKLKVYFSNDVGKEYLEYFMEYLSDVPKGYREYRNIKMAVVGVFYLADSESVKSLLEKNVPTSPKIDRMNMDNRLLQVQKAICRLAYHARPPLPISHIQNYIAGDYVHYSIPIFNNYFANLPYNEKFIESLLDAPLSIQKHGLRMAFKAYDVDTLIPIIENAWKNTKNVSLRVILYETLFDRLMNESEDVQKELYEVLKLYTSELNHDDHDNVYYLLVSDDLPDAFKGDFIETSWLTVNKFPIKSVDNKRRVSIIHHMENYLHLVQREFPRLQIIEDHISDMLCEKNIIQDHDERYCKELINAKWNLTAKYVVYTYIHNLSNEIEQQNSLHLLQTIMTESLQSWNLLKCKTYIFRKFVQKFIKTIMDKDPKRIESCATMIPIYQCIRDKLMSVLKREEMYLLNWELKLSIICRRIIDKTKNICTKNIAEAYGKAVGKTVKCCVQNEEFFRCFYQSIADIVNNIGRTACNIINGYSSGFVYYMCNGLITVKMTETHLLALLMLPRDPNYYWHDEHSTTIENIKKQAVSQEVISFLYQKYVLSDFEVRPYVM